MKALLALLVAAGCYAASPFTFQRENGGVTLYENGKQILSYIAEPKLAPGAPDRFRRCCYVYPLNATNGVNVLDDFPKDHYHHRGLFWAWPRVIVGGKEYDIWIPKGIREYSTSVRTGIVNDAANLNVTSEWLVGETAVVHLTQHLKVFPSAGATRKLELWLTLEAANAPVQIGGTLDAKKGYGGLGLRFARREDTIVRTDKGVEAKDTDLVPHPWAELDASYGGLRVATRVAIAEDSAAYPNGWCLRKYGFLGVNYPGLEPVTLQAGKPVRLHFIVTLTAE